MQGFLAKFPKARILKITGIRHKPIRQGRTLPYFKAGLSDVRKLFSLTSREKLFFSSSSGNTYSYEDIFSRSDISVFNKRQTVMSSFSVCCSGLIQNACGKSDFYYLG